MQQMYQSVVNVSMYDSGIKLTIDPNDIDPKNPNIHKIVLCEKILINEDGGLLIVMAKVPSEKEPRVVVYYRGSYTANKIHFTDEQNAKFDEVMGYNVKKSPKGSIL